MVGKHSTWGNTLYLIKNTWKWDKSLFLLSLKRYNTRYNNIARKILDFKTPNEVVEDYFSKNAT